MIVCLSCVFVLYYYFYACSCLIVWIIFVSHLVLHSFHSFIHVGLQLKSLILFIYLFISVNVNGSIPPECVPPLLSADVGTNNTHKTFINTLMYSISKQEHVHSCVCDQRM